MFLDSRCRLILKLELRTWKLPAWNRRVRLAQLGTMSLIVEKGLFQSCVRGIEKVSNLTCGQLVRAPLNLTDSITTQR